MPNKKAKVRKQKRRELDKRWSIEGRTAKQHKKWLDRQKERGTQLTVLGRGRR